MLGIEGSKITKQMPAAAWQRLSHWLGNIAKITKSQWTLVMKDKIARLKLHYLQDIDLGGVAPVPAFSARGWRGWHDVEFLQAAKLQCQRSEI
jgi:hypothetical protein